MICKRTSFIWLCCFFLLVHVMQAEQCKKPFNCQTKNNNTVLYTCRSITDCRYKSNLINDGHPKICGYEKIKQICIPRICCPEIRKPDPVIGIGITPRPPIEDPTVTLKPVPLTFGKKDPIAIANAKCVEYSKKVDCDKFFKYVVGGIPAKPKEFSHMALIGYGDDKDNIRWECGGSLISEHFVLTAAHCIDLDTGIIANWVRMGDLDYSSAADDANALTVRITERIIHPFYKKPFVYNDIALLKLDREVKFSPYTRLDPITKLQSPYLGPICLHTDTALNLGEEAQVTGWGITGVGEVQSTILLKANVFVESYKSCGLAFENDNNFPNGVDSKSMICALNREGKDSCTGDSGGPLQIYHVNYTRCMWDQIGIVSYGSLFCGDKKTPAIYTKVANYIGWIQKHVWP